MGRRLGKRLLSVCALIAASSVLSVVGCSSERRSQSYECHCDYMTDTDGVGVIDVRVCVAESADPVPAAAECGQGQGVGQVNGCKCPGVPEPCTGEPCEQAAARPSASP
ncbi:MAG: hypothetical protein JNK04_17990 [Myxococcales bacterium]|nr:hypothetical protein [Myxococcales bacterium]